MTTLLLANCIASPNKNSSDTTLHLVHATIAPLALEYQEREIKTGTINTSLHKASSSDIETACQGAQELLTLYQGEYDSLYHLQRLPPFELKKVEYRVHILCSL